MVIKPSYLTSGGALELAYRLLWLVVTGGFLLPYFVLDNRSAINADPTAWFMVLLVASVAFLYHAFRLFNVFFQKIAFENNILTLRLFLKTHIIPRDNFGSMWISYNMPRWKHAPINPRRSLRMTWEARVGFNQWKGRKKFRAARIGNGWDPKELAVFLKLVNGKETPLLGWGGGYKLDI